jgi:hypothetical protein
MPLPIIITAIMVITAFEEKPDSASNGSRTPVHAKASMQRMATTSMRSLSMISSTATITRMDKTIMISVFIIEPFYLDLQSAAIQGLNESTTS